MNTQQTIKHLTRAIRYASEGNADSTVTNILFALRSANSLDTPTTVKPKRAYNSTGKRGRQPALSTKQASDLIRRVNNGESVVSLAKFYGISQATAHRYLRLSRNTATTVTVQ